MLTLNNHTILILYSIISHKKNILLYTFKFHTLLDTA